MKFGFNWQCEFRDDAGNFYHVRALSTLAGPGTNVNSLTNLHLHVPAYVFHLMTFYKLPKVHLALFYIMLICHTILYTKL